MIGTFKEKDRQINFAIEELENLKIEILDIPKIYDDGQNGWYLRRSKVIALLDKHIAKLKGSD